MNRKKVLLALGIVVCCFAGLAIGLVLLVHHEPDFYRRSYIPPGSSRQDRSNRFLAKSGNFLQNIDCERKLDVQFSEDEINSFLAEDYASPHNVDKNFPGGIREPRIALDPSVVRIAFRYGEGVWSTVVSLELKVWLAANEPNCVVMQLEGLKAGSLPISAQSVLDRFAESLRQKDVEVTWYRREGKPAAVLRFQPGRKSPTVLLRNVELDHGRLHISVGNGGSAVSEEPPARANLRPETVHPLGN